MRQSSNLADCTDSSRRLTTTGPRSQLLSLMGQAGQGVRPVLVRAGSRLVLPMRRRRRRAGAPLRGAQCAQILARDDAGRRGRGRGRRRRRERLGEGLKVLLGTRVPRHPAAAAVGCGSVGPRGDGPGGLLLGREDMQLLQPPGRALQNCCCFTRKELFTALQNFACRWQKGASDSRLSAAAHPPHVSRTHTNAGATS